MLGRTTGCIVACALLLVAGCGSDSQSGASQDGGVGGAAAAAGSGAGTGGSAGTTGGTGGGGGYPALLSETGLYSDLAAGTLASGVDAYEPKYVLWSDGATKQRWVMLPPGATIDTSDMDYWSYPVGTKAWKEFSVGGKRIETRLLEKTATDWTMIAYQWRDDQTDADALPAGANDVAGTQHDIPASAACANCHRLPDKLLGVTAIQLDHPATGLTLATLVQRGQLSSAPSATFTVPGDAMAQAALGYLHANCGNCHNPKSAIFGFANMSLWLETGALGAVNLTPTYLTAVDKASGTGVLRIATGDAANSRIVQRMSSVASGQRMPPVGSEVVDDVGVAAVTAWIDAL